MNTAENFETKSELNMKNNQKDDQKDNQNNEQKAENEKYTFPDLTIDHINISFKVIGDLKENHKLNIKDNLYFDKDKDNDSLFRPILQPFNRRMSGQGHDKIMDFLDHLFLETKKNTEAILTKIRNGTNDVEIDNNVSILEDLVSNMVIFLHKYDTMKNVYKDDSATYSRLGVIRNKFFKFRHALFRNMTITSATLANSTPSFNI